MGRLPKPPEFRVLEGRTGSRYHQPKGQRPKPTPDPPGRPAWFNREAKAVWDLVLPELDRLGLLTRVDGGALVAYCYSYGEFENCAKAIKAEGRVIETQMGPVINPHARLAEKHLRFVKAFAAEFGLTPAARGRLTIPNRDAKGDLSDLLK